MSPIVLNIMVGCLYIVTMVLRIIPKLSRAAIVGENMINVHWSKATIFHSGENTTRKQVHFYQRIKQL